MYQERTDWVDTPKPPAKPGETPVKSADILRWERAHAEAHEQLDGRLSEATLNATYAPVAKAATKQPAAELMPFYAALANRHLEPCDILVLGDSIVEGQGATAISRRWLDVFRDRLRERFPTPGVTGGVGFIPPTNSATGTSGWGFTSSGNTIADPRGPGARGRILGADSGSGAGTVTITRTCTSFDLLYRMPSAPGSVTVTIDAAPPVSVTGPGGEATWSSGPLTAGEHTITIRQSAQTPTVEGIMFYNGDETKGIRVWDGARAGSSMGNMIAGGTIGVLWADSLPRIPADLIVVEYITNDVAAVDATQFRANLEAYVALIRSKVPSTPILLTAMFERGDTAAKSPWPQYLAALNAVADATPGCVFLDVGQRVPKLQPNTYGLMTDTLHPSDKGYGLIADAMLAILAPALS